MLPALLSSRSDLVHALSLHERKRLDATLVVAGVWPALSYLLLLLLRLGIGGIVFKLVPLVLAHQLCRQIAKAHPELTLAQRVQKALTIQLGIAASLEAGALLMVATLGPEEEVLQACMLLMVLCWAVHVVVGARLLQEYSRLR